MENVLKFIKNKAIGYYIVAFVALFSLIVAVVFLTQYSNPTLPAQMGNRATGLAPETIGVFLLAGFVVELVVLFMPEYRFFQLPAIVMFGMALYKEILIYPDFIAGKVNKVEYNGGNFGFNTFLIIALFLIVICAIVACFLGFVKENEEQVEQPQSAPVAANNEEAE